jgi:hypothetical protein
MSYVCNILRVKYTGIAKFRRAKASFGFALLGPELARDEFLRSDALTET